MRLLRPWHFLCVFALADQVPGGLTRSNLVDASHMATCMLQKGVTFRRHNRVEICSEDSYEPSALEQTWVTNDANWTGEDHCRHMPPSIQKTWVYAARASQLEGMEPTLLARSSLIFSKLCRAGEPPSFIEPLAGILRDPRFDCDSQISVLSKDWLVFPGAQSNGKRLFFDAGGSTFGEALDFFTRSYKARGTVFEKLFVWEARKQGPEMYWQGVDPQTRAFWEPRTEFYDGVPVTAEVDHIDNPVSRMYANCNPEDYCVFKLDIDTPSVELPLVQQLIANPVLTRSKVDEIFFEHHVHGVMQRYWGDGVNGTFADSYALFGALRRLGVRAHSWV